MTCAISTCLQKASGKFRRGFWMPGWMNIEEDIVVARCARASKLLQGLRNGAVVYAGGEPGWVDAEWWDCGARWGIGDGDTIVP